MTQSNVRKIVMAVLSLPAAFMLTVISADMAGRYRLPNIRATGQPNYIVPRLGVRHDFGTYIEAGFFGEMFSV